jgi:nucleoside triphosphate diphosphatase
VIVGLGPGDPDGVPARALGHLPPAGALLGLELDPEVAAVVGRPVEPLAVGAPVPPGACVLAPDPVAHRLARAHPEAVTWPERPVLRARAIGAEVAALAQVGAHLRRECPWDHEQTPESIVPHTIEEAFEVAEAVASGTGLADELGDLLFQPVFLAQLMEEDGGADLASIARGQAAKLVARHPHVYGEVTAADAAGVVDMWEARKRAERAGQGIFHDLPAGLPALAYATKAQKRAAAAGVASDGPGAALAALRQEVDALCAEPGAPGVGDVLFAAVAVARAIGADPELALRAAAVRFRRRVEGMAGPGDEEGR